jgi:hypothetical protein
MSEAIETSWEQYDEYMVATGQWLTEHDYAAMIENMYNQGYAEDEFDYSYEEATHGC